MSGNGKSATLSGGGLVEGGKTLAWERGTADQPYSAIGSEDIIEGEEGKKAQAKQKRVAFKNFLL